MALCGTSAKRFLNQLFCFLDVFCLQIDPQAQGFFVKRNGIDTESATESENTARSSKQILTSDKFRIKSQIGKPGQLVEEARRFRFALGPRRYIQVTQLDQTALPARPPTDPMHFGHEHALLFDPNSIKVVNPALAEHLEN